MGNKDSRQLIAGQHYSTMPSFIASNAFKAKDYKMKYNMNTGNFDLTLEDSKNVLKYFNFTASAVKIQRNGEKLILSAQKPYPCTGTP